MRMTIDTYKDRAGRLDTNGIDFAAFGERPLTPEALRCLEYMHDVELHTVCYLRDLLQSRAHREPDITSFLACWVFEELWHGEAIARVLAAHGRPAGSARVAPLRANRRRREARERLIHLVSATLVGEPFVAVHMAWGAVNEWSTQAGYARLARRAQHPVLTELLRRIMRQEGRHVDFYAAEAARRLQADRRARALTRLALRRFWRPVGSGVMPDTEVAFLVRYLFGDPEGCVAAERVDRHVDRLPGLGGLRLIKGSVEGLERSGSRRSNQRTADSAGAVAGESLFLEPEQRSCA
jgi:hypothetical protein